MSDEHKHQEEENKEVSSTQHADEQQNGAKNSAKAPSPRVIEPLPTTDVKPASNNHFKLHSYTGDNSKVKISNWIRMYESMAERSGWSEEEMKWNMSSYLEQEAFDFFVEHVLTKNQDWKEAKQSMVRRFDQYEMEPFMEFLSHKWSPQIELKEYFKKMRALGVAANLKEEDILAGLNRGLPVHLRSELNFVPSLQQWVAIAFCLQQRLNDNSSGYNKHQSWKPRGRGNSGRNRQNKQRNSHSQNLPTDQLLHNASNDAHHHDA